MKAIPIAPGRWRPAARCCWRHADGDRHQPSAASTATRGESAAEIVGADSPEAAPAIGRASSCSGSPQAQFAGYYAAEDQGYYEDEGLTVEFLPGGGDDRAAAGRLGSRTAPSSRSRGCRRCSRPARRDRTSCRSRRSSSAPATLAVSWKNSGITKPEDWAGQEGRRLALRQRVRGPRRRDPRRPDGRRPTTRASSRTST